MESQLREREKECQALTLEREKMEAQLQGANFQLRKPDKRIKALETLKLKSSIEAETQMDHVCSQIAT